MKTSESSLSFAVAKKSRVLLTEIDVRGAARKLGRVHAASTSTGHRAQASTFNSAL
ncbi:FXSXX-COOH protein [Streptomyces sp. NPDC058439]|uniref:FXSXX-COOH protein n=1 Tax=Streptomyces sp. NPDC058439 TaxID=3346500 RepID=UPI00365D924F